MQGAGAAIEPAVLAAAFSLSPAQRVTAVNSRLARVREELAAPVFQGSPQARELGEQIEEFSREAVTAGLHSLA